MSGADITEETSHLKPRFYKTVDEDATAQKIERAIAEAKKKKMPEAMVNTLIAKVQPVMVDMVAVKFAGDKNNEHHFRINEAIQYVRDLNQKQGYWLTAQELFPGAYDRFKRGLADLADGTPIEELDFLTEATRETFRSLNIHTAEALAGLDGSRLSNLGPNARVWQRKANAYVQERKQNANNDAMQRELLKRDDEIEALKEAIARLEGKPAPASGAKSKAKTAAPAEQAFTNKDGKPLRGAALAAAKRKAAAAPVVEAPETEVVQEDGAGDTPDPVRMLKAMDAVDLRNMLEAYGVTMPETATKAQLVAKAIEANEKAEKGIRATETEDA